MMLQDSTVEDTSKLAKVFEFLAVAADRIASRVDIPIYLVWGIFIWLAIFLCIMGVLFVEKFLAWIRWFLAFTGILLLGAIILMVEIIK